MYNGFIFYTASAADYREKKKRRWKREEYNMHDCGIGFSIRASAFPPDVRSTFSQTEDAHNARCLSMIQSIEHLPYSRVYYSV